LITARRPAAIHELTTSRGGRWVATQNRSRIQRNCVQRHLHMISTGSALIIHIGAADYGDNWQRMDTARPVLISWVWPATASWRACLFGNCNIVSARIVPVGTSIGGCELQGGPSEGSPRCVRSRANSRRAIAPSAESQGSGRLALTLLGAARESIKKGHAGETIEDSRSTGDGCSCRRGPLGCANDLLA
jgi:hypothetical protein